MCCDLKTPSSNSFGEEVQPQFSNILKILQEGEKGYGFTCQFI